MEYSPEQRAIIARMGELSQQMREVRAAQDAISVNQGQNLIQAATALTEMMRLNGELTALAERHGDAFREFLDTL